MVLRHKINNRRMKTLFAGLVIGLGSTACATSAVTVNTQGAPITYKINGEGGGQYASLKRDVNLGHSGLAPISRPITSSPQNLTQPLAQPRSLAPIAPRLPEIQFNARSVDRELYAHQRVGKPYKIAGKRYTPKHQPKYDKTGLASWYGPKFNGKPTASGEIFDKSDLTAAHKTLPLNSLVHVTNLENGRTLIVRVNDRGPFVDDRIIDLSEATAKALGTIQNGLAKVRVRYAGPADPSAAKHMYNAPSPRPQTPPAPLAAERPQALSTPAPQRPLAPQPQMQPQPQPQLQPQAQSEYQSLRSLGGQLSLPPVQPTPQPERVSEVEMAQPLYEQPQYDAPVYDAPIPPHVPAPIARDRLAPITPPRPAQGGNVTLTIKGPIHLAVQDDDAKAPTWIPAVNRVNKTR
jgi:rare lipoprotein A